MIIFAPSTLSTISHALNFASVISVSTRNQLSLSLSEGIKEPLANSLQTLSHIAPPTTLTLTAVRQHFKADKQHW